MSTAEIGSRVIETACGLFIDPLDPDPAQFRLGDIGHALANMCRYNGHTRRFYSVAEHSLLVGDLLRLWGKSKEIILQGLMHDASEAYMPDLTSPVKRTSWGKSFREVEDITMARIGERYGFAWPMLPVVKEADTVLLWCEARALLPTGGRTWSGFSEGGKLAVDRYPEIVDWIKTGKRREDHHQLVTSWQLAVMNEGSK